MLQLLGIGLQEYPLLDQNQQLPSMNYFNPFLRSSQLEHELDLQNLNASSIATFHVCQNLSVTVEKLQQCCKLGPHTVLRVAEIDDILALFPKHK